MRMLAESSSGLDAVTYFFANSFLFIVITGAAFFALGMLFGNLIWGRFKRRYEKSVHEIESYKGELALLKRRLADKVSRPAPAPAPAYVPPAVVATPAAVPLSPLAALVRGSGKPTDASGAMGTRALPPGQGFSIWTEADWAPSSTELSPFPPSAAFSLWTLAPEPVHGTEVRHKSHAFTLWTERNWKPHPPHGPPPPPAVAFSLWTLPDFEPSGRGAVPESRAFSLWTDPSWSPPKISGLPPRSARSFSLWTEEDFVPTGRGPVQPSLAWSLWTAPDWEMPVVKPAPQPESAAFTLWTEHVTLLEPATTEEKAKEEATAPGASPSKPALSETELKKTKGSVFARALAAARAAFKTQESGS
jgi:hypothetical protein